jgi:hypothetical protein
MIRNRHPPLIKKICGIVFLRKRIDHKKADMKNTDCIFLTPLALPLQKMEREEPAKQMILSNLF